MISKEAYTEAAKVVAEYENQIEEEFNQRAEVVKKELKEYFSNNKVCGVKIKEVEYEVQKFRGDDNSNWHLSIIPIQPDFDEDYDDDNADKDIEAIGEKYNIRVGWTYGVYGK